MVGMGKSIAVQWGSFNFNKGARLDSLIRAGSDRDSVGANELGVGRRRN